MNELVRQNTFIGIRGKNPDFWRQFQTFIGMSVRLREMDTLIRQLRLEPVFSDQVRQQVLQPLLTERASNLSLFREFLQNFINTAGQGLHQVDFECSATLITVDVTEISLCRLLVEGHTEALPCEIGSAFISGIVANRFNDSIIERVLAFYQEFESRYDILLAGDLSRCSLHLCEVVYPGSGTRVDIRLPASVLIESGAL